MLPAYLIIQTIALNGFQQGVSALQYRSMIDCAQAKARVHLNFSDPTARVVTLQCEGKPPQWWVKP